MKDETWSVFNSFAKFAIGQPNLKGKALFRTFSFIEDQIWYGIDLLVDHTSFVEDNLCYLLSEIAMGRIKSRKVYKGKRNKKRVIVGSGHTIGKPNFDIFVRGFDLFKLSKLPREVSSPKVKSILRTLNLSNHVYENILRAFVKETKNYCRLMDLLLVTHLEMKSTTDEFVKVQLEDRYSDIRDDLTIIEQSVACCRPTRLYGIVRILQSVLSNVNRYQSQVQRSYQKMIPKPARAKGRSENESLDLFQAGSLGLSRAVSLFDPDSNASFASFANWWINQRIMGAAKLSGPLIKLPWSLWETYQKILRQKRQFELNPSKRYTYTEEDVAKAIGKSVKTVRKVLEKVDTIKMVDLDSYLRKEDGSETDHSVSQILTDHKEQEKAETTEHQEQIRDLLKYLSVEERTLICLKFGILEEIDNSKMDKLQVVKEILRQSACKAKLYLLLTNQMPSHFVNQTTEVENG